MTSEISTARGQQIIIDELDSISEKMFGLSRAYDCFGVSMGETSNIFREFQYQAMARRVFDTAVARFENESFPTANVVVEEILMDKNDPMNPNPKAGRSKRYQIVINGRKSKTLGNSVVAISKAELIHNNLIKALKEQRQKENPNWGRF